MRSAVSRICRNGRSSLVATMDPVAAMTISTIPDAHRNMTAESLISSTIGMPRRRASVQTAERPTCRPAMPPHARPKSPFPERLRSTVEGEWSLTIASIVPSRMPCHADFRASSPSELP